MTAYSPASDRLIAEIREAVREADEHQHPDHEDFYCQNHRAWIGERMGNVLARLDMLEKALDAELAARRADQRHSAQPGTDAAATGQGTVTT